MAYSLVQVFVIETIGTCILVFFGIAATANETLPRTKGNGRIGQMGISISFGLGLFLALQLLGHISGLFNPAIALGVAIRGDISWSDMGVSWAGQMIGAFTAAILMWLSYYKHFDPPPNAKGAPVTQPGTSNIGPGNQADNSNDANDVEARKDTPEGETSDSGTGNHRVHRHGVPHRALTAGDTISDDQGTKLGVFVTRPAVGSKYFLAPLWTEFFGTFLLTYAALAISDQRKIFLTGPNEGADLYRTGLEPLLIGLMLTGIFICIGGVTGPALNPARDLGPRLAHAILPIPGKGRSEWWYAWVPILGPVAGGILGAQFNHAITRMLRSGAPPVPPSR